MTSQISLRTRCFRAQSRVKKPELRNFWSGFRPLFHTKSSSIAAKRIGRALMRSLLSAGEYASVALSEVGVQGKGP